MASNKIVITTQSLNKPIKVLNVHVQKCERKSLPLVHYRFWDVCMKRVQIFGVVTENWTRYNGNIHIRVHDGTCNLQCVITTSDKDKMKKKHERLYEIFRILETPKELERIEMVKKRKEEQKAPKIYSLTPKVVRSPLRLYLGMDHFLQVYILTSDRNYVYNLETVLPQVTCSDYLGCSEEDLIYELIYFFKDKVAELEKVEGKAVLNCVLYLLPVYEIRKTKYKVQLQAALRQQTFTKPCVDSDSFSSDSEDGNSTAQHPTAACSGDSVQSTSQQPTDVNPFTPKDNSFNRRRVMEMICPKPCFRYTPQDVYNWVSPQAHACPLGRKLLGIMNETLGHIEEGLLDVEEPQRVEDHDILLCRRERCDRWMRNYKIHRPDKKHASRWQRKRKTTRDPLSSLGLDRADREMLLQATCADLAQFIRPRRAKRKHNLWEVKTGDVVFVEGNIGVLFDEKVIYVHHMRWYEVDAVPHMYRHYFKEAVAKFG